MLIGFLAAKQTNSSDSSDNPLDNLFGGIVLLGLCGIGSLATISWINLSIVSLPEMRFLGLAIVLWFVYFVLVLKILQMFPKLPGLIGVIIFVSALIWMIFFA